MAEAVEIEQTNITVTTDEEHAVVEFRYFGVNEDRLAALIVQVAGIQDIIDQVVADVGGELAPITTTLSSLQSQIDAVSASLTSEISTRGSADTVLGASISALDVELSALIAAEPIARDAAIAVETAAREAAITALDASLSDDIAAVQTNVDAHTALITAIDAAQTALAADFTALSADFTALEASFTTWTSDFTDVQTAVTDEIAARATAEAAIIASIPTTENIQDIVAGLLVQGSGVILTYNDAAGTLTISASTTSNVDSLLTDFNGDALSDDAGNLVTETI